MRWLIGTGAGVVAALLLLFMIETFGDLVYPLPEPDGAVDPREQAQLISNQPFAAKLLILTAWFAGTLVGAGLAVRLAGSRLPVWPVALAVIVRNVFAMSALAYPGWMWLAAILLPILAAWLAARYMPRPAAAEPALLGPGPHWL